MINERPRHIWRRIWADGESFAVHNRSQVRQSMQDQSKTMTSQMTTIRHRRPRDFSGLPAAVQAGAEAFGEAGGGLSAIADSMTIISTSATPANTIPMGRRRSFPDMAIPAIPAVPVIPVEHAAMVAVTAGSVAISKVPQHS
jgi:hypothetical protein